MPVTSQQSDSLSRRKSPRIQKRTSKAYEIGTLVQKYFEADDGGGWYEGFVTSTRPSATAGTVWYRIQYEDGDVEDLDGWEMAELVQNAIEDRKNETTKKKPRRNAPIKGRTKNKYSSLWDGIFGTEQGSKLRDTLLSKIDANPPSTALLPKYLWERLPLIVEFWLLVHERQMIFLGKRTEVPIFIDYHFCNDYRELDRGICDFTSFNSTGT